VPPFLKIFESISPMTTVNLKLTAAIAIGGEIIHAGEIIEVSQEAAKNLLHRGKAELATGEDDPMLDDEVGTADPDEVSPTATATDDASARPTRNGPKPR
jgi:hypothetical protein